LSIYRYRSSPFDLGPEVRVGARLGGILELVSYRVDSTQLIPGEAQHLTLTWRALEQLTRALHVRVRLYEMASGRIWAQVDKAEPANIKTRLWPVGRSLTAAIPWRFLTTCLMAFTRSRFKYYTRRTRCWSLRTSITRWARR